MKNMKKILFGLLITLSLVGCKEKHTRIVHYENVLQVIKFEFEGHNYMAIEVSNTGHTNIAGVVHDPNCPCQNNQENE